MWDYSNNKKINKHYHRYNLNRGDKRSFLLNNGDFGLRALKSGYILRKEIVAVNFYLKKNIKKTGKIWYRISVNKVITKKPIETRMGKGKGSFFSYGSFVNHGRIILEIKTISPLVSEKLLKGCISRFSLPMCIVKGNL